MSSRSDGLDERWYRTSAEIRPINPDRRVETVDQFFKSLSIDIRHGGDDAFYVLTEDYIQMPPFGLFHDAESYYATLAHESVHWTRHDSRLKRRFPNTGRPGAAYAKEELVAEIGSAFLSAELGITPSIRADHADYIGAWLRVLEGDSRAIFTAASQASKAVTWLHKHAHVERLDLNTAIGEAAVVAPVTTVATATENRPAVEPKPWPDHGVPIGAVQGELFREAPAADAYLVAARDARLFAGEACAFQARVSGDGDEEASRQEAGRLLAAADRIDLGTPGVKAAIEATLAISGPGRGQATDAAAFLSAFRAEAQRRLQSRGEAEGQQWSQLSVARHGGVSM